MGWFDETKDPEYRHEGYVVALVQENGWRYRELGVGDEGEHAIEWVQVACSCGWRSPRLLAPVGTKWWPCCVELPEFMDDPYHWEDVAKLAWDEHPFDEPGFVARSLRSHQFASRSGE